MAWAEKLPSGRYRAMYRDAAGRKRSTGKTFTHKARAERAAGAAEDQARQASWADPAAGKRLWSDWVAEWWPSRTVGEGTAKRDLARRVKHLDPRWGTVPVAAIKRQDVRGWAAQLRAGGLGPESVKRCVHLLSASLSAAVDAEMISANPAARLKLPGGQQAIERYLTREEVDALVDEMPTTDDQLVLWMLVYTGLRFGELAGLHWNRVDLSSGVLRVVETFDEQVNKVAPYPKGKRIRDVPIPDFLVAKLARRPRGRTCGVAHQTGRCRGGLVLTAERGGPLRITNWENRVWKPALERARVGGEQVVHARVHDCRHTYASWLLQAGLDLAEVGQLMGHLSAATTQKYAHLKATRQGKVLDALGAPGLTLAPRLPHAEGDSALA